MKRETGGILMYTYLIVDDEPIERKGVRMLLHRLNVECEIIEASNGEDALDVLEKERVDILLTDINMPFLDGIGLLEQVSRRYPGLPSVIFSGYNEFDYAKKAIAYGVSAYILKPVNPEEFARVMGDVQAKLEQSNLEKKRKDESMDFVKEHLLYLMVNGQSRVNLEEKAGKLIDLDFVKQYVRMMLIECSNNFFEQVDETAVLELKSGIHNEFQYLNLNPQQSVLLFYKAPFGGWELLGQRILNFIKNTWQQDCFLALSSDMKKEEKELSIWFAQVERLMEQKFYHTTTRVFMPFREETASDSVQTDAEILIQQIQQDIKVKDMDCLQEHFRQFCDRYQSQTNFSQIYIKFMFSNLLKEIYDNLPDMDEQALNREIDQLYHCMDMKSMVALIQAAINKLEKTFLFDKGSKRKEVERIQQYVRLHYSDSGLGVDQLAREVNMTPNYLSSIFKKETGENLSAYLKRFRMERARELLADTNEKIGDICIMCGFVNVSYFCQSFREFFGVSPKKYREQGEK